MRVITKILLTILIFCGGSIIVQAIVHSMGNKYSSGGIGPFIIYPAMIAGIWAVWKYRPEKKDDNDKHTLNKN
jgi:predicted tellurium resistance membrane protein TerC